MIDNIDTANYADDNTPCRVEKKPMCSNNKITKDISRTF